MRNDGNIKVICVTNNERKDEFHIDYYDKEGKMVGTVAVEETGKLGWNVWNQLYKEDILSAASYIMGKEIENTKDDILEAKQGDLVRWDRAQEYIFNRALGINYKQNKEFNETFKNGLKR